MWVPLLKFGGVERTEDRDRTSVRMSLLKIGTETEEGRCRKDRVTSTLLRRLSLAVGVVIGGNETKGSEVGNEPRLEGTKDVIGIDTPSPLVLE